MGNETKWADVAHYYKYVEHEVLVSHSGNREPLRRISDGGEDLSIYYRRSDLVEAGFITVPTLRHRDDMTEADEVAAFEYVEQREWPEKWPKITKSLMISRSFNMDDPKAARLFLWLISHGFDMFGLIESGQAIRKEAGNGL